MFVRGVRIPPAVASTYPQVLWRRVPHGQIVTAA